MLVAAMKATKSSKRERWWGVQVQWHHVPFKGFCSKTRSLCVCMRTVDGYRNDTVKLAVDEKKKENGTLWHSLLELWENLDGRIEACLRIMDLPDEMREPKWYPIHDVMYL